MPLDPRLEPLLGALQAAFTGDSIGAVDVASPADRRAALMDASRAFQSIYGIVPDNIDVEDLLVTGGGRGVPLRVYRPGPGTLPAVLFIHGGAFWTGGLDQADGPCRRIADQLGCVVVSVGYRLAPEHVFPAALEDSWAAYEWLLAEHRRLGVDPASIGIVGQSSGANLAAVIAQRAIHRGNPRLRAQVLDIPFLDATLSHASIDAYGQGFGLSARDLREALGFYAPHVDPKAPELSPLFGNVSGLPPTLIVVNECDPLRDEGIAYAKRLSAAGVDCQLEERQGMVHGACDLHGLLPDVGELHMQSVTGFLRKHLA